MWKAATIVLAAAVTGFAAALPAVAQTASTVPSPPQSSSERVRDNPSSQYVLIKTVVGQSIGVVDARALPVEPEGYNLLKYCWAVGNVLGDWAEHAGLTGAMVTRALETHSWARDLERGGYPAAPVSEAIGQYEAALIASGFTDAARDRALDALTASLEEIRRTATGAAKVFKTNRCGRQLRSMALQLRLLAWLSSWPKTLTVPPCGCRRPMMVLSSTDLPVPDPPTTPKISPRRTTRSR